MSVRAHLESLEPRLSLSSSGLSTYPSTLAPPTFPSASALPLLILDRTTPRILPPKAPLRFDSIGAGYIYHLGDFHNIRLASPTGTKTVITDIQILGEGFISPDLSASTFPVTIGKYTARDDIVADFDVFLYSTTPGQKTATLRITTTSGNLDLVLQGVVEPAVKSAEVHIYNSRKKFPLIGNGQNVDLGVIQRSDSGRHFSRSLQIVNTGNVPFLADALVDASFDVGSPSGGSSSGFSSVGFGGRITYNAISAGHVVDTPGYRPGQTQYIVLDIPTAQIGTYHSSILIRSNAPNISNLTISASAQVVNHAPKSPAFGTVTGKTTAIKPVPGGLQLSSLTLGPQGQNITLDGLLAGEGYTPHLADNSFTLNVINTLPLAFSGYESLILDTYAGDTLLASQYAEAFFSADHNTAIPANGSGLVQVTGEMLSNVPAELIGQPVTITARFRDSFWTRPGTVSTTSHLTLATASLEIAAPDLTTPPPLTDIPTDNYFQIADKNAAPTTLLRSIFPAPLFTITNTGNIPITASFDASANQRRIPGSAPDPDYHHQLPRSTGWEATISLLPGESKLLPLHSYCGNFVSRPESIFDLTTPNAPIDIILRYFHNKTVQFTLTSADLPQSSSPG